MQTSSPRLGPGAAGSRGARENANVVTLIQEALCSGDARCVVEAVEKACRLKGLPVPHELYGEMTLESLIAVMAAIGLDLRTEPPKFLNERGALRGGAAGGVRLGDAAIFCKERVMFLNAK